MMFVEHFSGEVNFLIENGLILFRSMSSSGGDRFGIGSTPLNKIRARKLHANFRFPDETFEIADIN